MTKVTMELIMPDELLQAFLQHMRDFDTRHDPEHKDLVKMAIGVEAPDLPAATLETIFRNVRPPFEEERVYPGKGAA